MRQNNFLPIVIFSAYQHDRPEEVNKRRHFLLKADLAFRGIPYEEVIGYYKGRREDSLLVSALYHEEVTELARVYDQESILYSGPDRWSRLEFINSNNETFDLGTLQPISKHEAKQLDAYTIRDGVYYACKL